MKQNAFGLIPLCLLLFGCNRDSGTRIFCEPGEVRECPCGGGRPVGVQTCRERGGGWNPCVCETDGFSDTDTDADTDTDTDADSDTDTDTDADSDTDTDTDTDADSDTDTDTDTVSDTDADTDTDTDSDSDCTGEACLTPTDDDTGTDGDTDTDTDTDSDTESDTATAGFTGVDILLVVDNSISMSEEQSILATSIYTLLNTLVAPLDGAAGPGADEIRAAVVSTDIGLSYGPNGDTTLSPSNIPLCVLDGDDGAFRVAMPGSVSISSRAVACIPSGGQCPDERWTCESGFCTAPDGAEVADVGCSPSHYGPWIETNKSAPNESFVRDMSCLTNLGTEGCGMEQPLQAAVRALTRPDQAEFLSDNHLLTVIVISDEEDCSIEDSALFVTSEWNDPMYRNTACNYPESQELDYLFDADYFYTALTHAKHDRSDAVLFSAFVGVPYGDSSPCQGAGTTLDGCLDAPEMALTPQTATWVDPTTGDPIDYVRFTPACTRLDADERPLTEAQPGRRFVKLAQKFGDFAYVYSICNPDWRPAMAEVAEMINARVIAAD